MHLPEKNKFNLEQSDDSRVDTSFIHENEREIRNISKLVSDFRDKITEDLSTGKRIDWMDAFNNNFTPILMGCGLFGVVDKECSDVMKFKTETENEILSENREINEEEKEKIYELVKKIGVALDSILNK